MQGVDQQSIPPRGSEPDSHQPCHSSRSAVCSASRELPVCSWSLPSSWVSLFLRRPRCVACSCSHGLGRPDRARA